MAEDLYKIGSITQTHGIRGEVKVFPHTDDVSRFKKAKGIILKSKSGDLVLDVESARPQKNLVILKFKGIDNINDIEKYKGCDLYVTKENRVALEENEYFMADLMGLKVTSDEGEDLGEITDILETGANDVYVVNNGGKDLLIPAIKDCILEVDLENGTMKVHLLEGLKEL